MRSLAILGALAIASCGSPKLLEIRQHHLRSVDADTGGIDSIRAEKLMRLHGAVSVEEQRERLGHYYSVHWRGPEGREDEPVRVVFRYRQAASGSKILTMEQRAPGGRKGTFAFQVTGPAYLEGGRILSWHLSFARGSEVVATQQSYLWE